VLTLPFIEQSAMYNQVVTSINSYMATGDANWRSIRGNKIKTFLCPSDVGADVTANAAGGNWARGRAMESGVWLRDGEHNFCAVLSGGRGFLGGTELPQEISIQLWKINPCCPGTLHPMGDARRERVADVLRRVAGSPVFQKLNEGDPYAMGESLGIGAEEGHRRAGELGNVCLWCDEFFARHFDMSTLEARTEPERKALLPVLNGRRR